MKCKDCKEEGCPFRCYTENGECSYVDFSEDGFDWQSFRAEAAKDILCALLSNPNETPKGDIFQLSHAMFLVDELIKQLKEKEKK